MFVETARTSPKCLHSYQEQSLLSNSSKKESILLILNEKQDPQELLLLENEYTTRGRGGKLPLIVLIER